MSLSANQNFERGQRKARISTLKLLMLTTMVDLTFWLQSVDSEVSQEKLFVMKFQTMQPFIREHGRNIFYLQAFHQQKITEEFHREEFTLFIQVDFNALWLLWIYGPLTPILVTLPAQRFRLWFFREKHKRKTINYRKWRWWWTCIPSPSTKLVSVYLALQHRCYSPSRRIKHRSPSCWWCWWWRKRWSLRSRKEFHSCLDICW